MAPCGIGCESLLGNLVFVSEGQWIWLPNKGGTLALRSDLADAAAAATNYIDAAIAALPESVSPETVTNIVRECSLGGIWDRELEVWWTPVMVGGSLTYQATTNVNLNAEN